MSEAVEMQTLIQVITLNHKNLRQIIGKMEKGKKDRNQKILYRKTAKKIDPGGNTSVKKQKSDLEKDGEV